MKLFILAVLAFLAGLADAQNNQDYMNICTPGITLYNTAAGNIKAFRLDSVEPLAGNDTVLISYRTIHPFVVISCFDTTKGSILGRKVIKEHDGTFRFFNYTDDTITIRTQATTGETWKFCTLSDTSRIDATVTAIIQDTVLGITDSVKVITLQAKNTAGQNIPHFLNQKDIRLSKHYGLSKVFDTYFIPDLEYNAPDPYYICGKSEPALGMQNLTWKDIYDFEVGDEFHYYGSYWYGGPSWQIIRRILQKEIYGNMDSVKYVIEYCKILWLPMPPPNTQTTFDTITETYNFAGLANDTAILLLPEEFRPYNSVFIMTSQFLRNLQYNGRQTHEITYNAYTRYSPPPCWNTTFEIGGPTERYSAGLGHTYTFYMYIDNPQVIVWSEDLVYYKKGNETWGTPVAPSCNVLVGTEEGFVQGKPSISVIPNPAGNEVRIILTGVKDASPDYISVYDFSGRVVFKGKMDVVPYILQCGQYNEGLYIIQIRDKSGAILGTEKLVISR